MLETRDEGVVYNAVKSTLNAYAFDRFPSFEDLSSDLESELGAEALPFLDRRGIDESKLTADQKYWRENGYIVFKNAIPHDVIDRYVELRKRAKIGQKSFPALAPYDSFDEIKDVCLHGPLMDRVRAMLGYDVSLFFNLSSFRSSERGWHQDDYMCEPHVAATGVAMWMSFDEIDADAGPFEFIPGSHRWPIMRKEKVIRYLTPEAAQTPNRKFRYWAELAEYYVNPACDSQIAKAGVPSRTFMARKGDVLVWHAALMHRGSHAKNPALDRPALIAHYCDPTRTTVDGGLLKTYKTGASYFTFPGIPKLVVGDDGLKVPSSNLGHLAIRAAARIRRALRT
jgi:hypothetical protein